MTVNYNAALARDRFELAFIDGVLAGLIHLVFEDVAVLIENVAVAPPLQRKGVGRRLIQQAELLARDTARQRVRLYTNKRFQENISIYQSLGYRIEREEPMGDAVAVHMSKSIG